MNSKHTVEINDLINFINEEYKIFASSYGRGSNKELRCMLKGSYQVWGNGEIIMESSQPYPSVEMYNKLK